MCDCKIYTSDLRSLANIIGLSTVVNIDLTVFTAFSEKRGSLNVEIRHDLAKTAFQRSSR